MRNLKERIFSWYEELAKIDRESEYETFCAQWGEEYKQGGVMFVGRAVNDWVTQGDRNTSGMFQDGSTNQAFARADQMKWVEDKQYYKVSAFWRVVKAIIQNTICAGNDWYKHAVWSNLYKLSPTGGGNPSNSLCKKQLEICIDIFKKEIETFDPKFIVCLSGIGWYYDFLCGLNNDTEPVVVHEETWGDYKATIYRIGNRYYIGSEHPQGKNERAHINTITKLLKELM